MLVYPIRAKNDRLITIAGGTGTGATTLAKGLTWRLRDYGYKAIRISSGDLYRTVAYLAYEYARKALTNGRIEPPSTDAVLARAVQVDATTLVGQMSSMRLVKGRVYLGDSRVRNGIPTNLDIAAITPIWGGNGLIHDAINQIILKQINAFDGWVVLEGRSVNYEFNACARLFLTVNDKTAKDRKKFNLQDVRARNRADRLLEHGPLRRSPRETRISTTKLSKDELLYRVFEQKIHPKLPLFGYTH